MKTPGRTHHVEEEGGGEQRCPARRDDKVHGGTMRICVELRHPPGRVEGVCMCVCGGAASFQQLLLHAPAPRSAALDPLTQQVHTHNETRP